MQGVENAHLSKLHQSCCFNTLLGVARIAVGNPVKAVRIGLLGCGTVGGGVVKLLIAMPRC